MPIYNPTPTTGGGGLPYAVYTALISQSGIAAPTVQIIQNTIGAIVWSYTGIGIYTGTLAGAFTANKTFCLITYNEDMAVSPRSAMNQYEIRYLNVNAILIETAIADLIAGGGSINTDGILAATPIEIRVYP